MSKAVAGAREQVWQMNDRDQTVRLCKDCCHTEEIGGQAVQLVRAVALRQ
jgi:hypothetical protein